MRARRREVLRIALAIAVATVACTAASWADGVGVIVAPAGERMTEAEALYAEGVVAGLVEQGRRAVLLHEASPLLRSGGVNLPSVSADDDWTPLVSVLDRIATRLRLDHVLLAAHRADSQPGMTEGLLVVRGGASRELRAASSDRTPAAFATRVAAAIEDLPAPSDRADEAVPLPQTDIPAQPPEPAAEPPIEAEAAPPPDERPGTGERPALTVADEPETVEEPAEAPDADEADDALLAAEAAYREGRLSEAEALVEASLRETGASARAYYLRARLSLARQDRDAAIGDLQRAVGIDRSLADAQVWLARLLVEQGLWQTAQEHYEQAVEARPGHLEALLGLARLYRDHGHRRKAIALLTAAADRGQDDASLLMLLAELHGREGNIELAERYFVRAASVAKGEQRAAAWERLGDLYVTRHRHREALTAYVKAAEFNPSRTTMVERRYTEVMSAADGAVHEALTEGWSVFEDYAYNGVGHREMVHRRLSEMRAQLEEAMRFAESIKPPGALSAGHVERQFAYSLALEASVIALTWLDLGEDGMVERACEVHADAVREFERLRGAGRG
ncbi:MAG: tetratricopeptide repeat protein [Armatimonadota bacterium]